MVDDDLGSVLEKLRREQAEGLKNQGNEFYKQGNFDEALSCYDKALGIVPDYSDALNNKGLVFIKLGRIDEAKQCHQIITELKNRPDPQSPPKTNPVSRPSDKTDIRNPLTAAALSLVVAGWGQWYAGRTWDGLKFFGLVNGISLVAIIFHGTIGPLAFVFSLIGLIFWIFGIIDAHKTANRINRHELEFNGKSRLFWLPVILLISALILCLAAVILAMLLFTPLTNTPHIKNVAVFAHSDQNGLITIENAGVSDLNLLSFINVSVNGIELPTRLSSIPGSKITAHGLPGQRNRVKATARFIDGTDQVVLDMYVTVPVTTISLVQTVAYSVNSTVVPDSQVAISTSSQNTGTSKPKFKWGDVIKGTLYSSDYYSYYSENFIVTNNNPEDSGHYILHRLYDCPKPQSIIVNVTDVDKKFTRVGNQNPDTVCEGLPMSRVSPTSPIYYT